MAYWGSHARVFQLVLHSFCVFWPCRSRGGVPPGHVTTLVRDLIPQLARGPLICPKQNPEQIAQAPELGKYFSSAYGRVAAARVARAASLATTLPRIFDLSFKAISTIVLASFLLVDLGSPQFEAILFAVLACSFYLLESFVDDLEDPFGGSWTVDAALDACDELVDALAVEE